MVLVFGAFVLGGERIIELFGIGLASAVLLDALIVRSVLVPALMMLLRRRQLEDPALARPGPAAPQRRGRRQAEPTPREPGCSREPEPAAG